MLVFKLDPFEAATADQIVRAAAILMNADEDSVREHVTAQIDAAIKDGSLVQSSDGKLRPPRSAAWTLHMEAEDKQA